MARRRPDLPAVYAIADVQTLAPQRLSDAVGEMAEAGLTWIQVRAKKMDDHDLFEELEVCCRELEGSKVSLWIDDRVDIAALFPVAGVHLGQRDLPPPAARNIVGDGLWIGHSTHNEIELREAESEPEVDVIALGPVFPTTGKEYSDPVVGLQSLRDARARIAKPLVAIGGIDRHNIADVLAAGADSAAVLGAVCRGNVAENCRRLLDVAEACR